MIPSERTSPRVPLSPSGRGREAMTYGRGRRACECFDIDGASVSHLAELVRGNFFLLAVKAPRSGCDSQLEQLEAGRQGEAAGNLLHLCLHGRLGFRLG